MDYRRKKRIIYLIGTNSFHRDNSTINEESILEIFWLIISNIRIVWNIWNN